jgi:hypothetical protein
MANKPDIPRADLDVWLMVNEDGEYVASHDEDNLSELYDDYVGGSSANLRTIRLSLSVPLPQPVNVSVELPDVPQPGEPLSLVVL